jgi:hypothetical protein
MYFLLSSRLFHRAACGLAADGGGKKGGPPACVVRKSSPRVSHGINWWWKPLEWRRLMKCKVAGETVKVLNMSSRDVPEVSCAVLE